MDGYDLSGTMVAEDKGGHSCVAVGCGFGAPGDVKVDWAKAAEATAMAVGALVSPELAAAFRVGLTAGAIRGAALKGALSSGEEGELAQFGKAFAESWRALGSSQYLSPLDRLRTAFVTAAGSRYFGPEIRTMVANLIRTVFKRGG